MKKLNWLTTTQALELIPLSRRSLLLLVKGKHLKHGIHYLDRRLPGSSRANLLWNPSKVMEWLENNPEKR